MNLTILTATYNRKSCLEKLYRSLCAQTVQDFRWLVIDDGSTDETEKYIADAAEESCFEIEYHRQENGGKHRALNHGMGYVNTPLVFIVDSDDYLTEDAVGTILERHEEYKSSENICGYSFLRGDGKGGYLSKSGIPYEGLEESYVECRINRNIPGDMAEVWKTECLKKYPFPEYENEKFLGEDVVWVEMSGEYKMLFFNDVIYISGYRNDGLTKNRRYHNLHSPKGCYHRAATFLKSNANLQTKMKNILQFYIYGRYAGKTKKEIFQECPHRNLLLAESIPAWLIYQNWKIRYKV